MNIIATQLVKWKGNYFVYGAGIDFVEDVAEDEAVAEREAEVFFGGAFGE